MQHKEVLRDIYKCIICKEKIPENAHPVLSFNPNSKIVIIGQAPGRIVNETNIPFNDKSGDNLRKWLGVNREQFYNTDLFSIVPMAFCYPGTGKSGDLAPPKICAKTWHTALFGQFKQLELVVLVGKYAQDYYLKDVKRNNLTLTVKNFEAYLPKYFALPHPSPRNNIWMKKNEWFTLNVLPILSLRIKEILEK